MPKIRDLAEGVNAFVRRVEWDFFEEQNEWRVKIVVGGLNSSCISKTDSPWIQWITDYWLIVLSGLKCIFLKPRPNDAVLCLTPERVFAVLSHCTVNDGVEVVVVYVAAKSNQPSCVPLEHGGKIGLLFQQGTS